jgi:hypothetical protein
MLTLIGTELAPLVTKSAKATATNILTENYREVETEIRDAVEAMPDPLQAAAKAVVASREEQVKRSDAKRRKQVLEGIRAIRSSDPIAVSRGA